MRRLLLLPILALALTPLLHAQAEKEAEGGKRVENLLPHQKEFLNISEERRKSFLKHINEATRLFSEKRILECMEALNLADKAFKDSPEALNLRGSCYVELRAFDKALASFEKAREMVPNNFSFLFNIGEVHFVTHDWQKAHDFFETMLKNLPKERMDLMRISEFKLMLCKLKIGKQAEAIALANKYDFLDDSPYHYFAHAALAYEKDDEAEAQQWIIRAARIFQKPGELAPWHDTLVEFGHIKSFYGGPSSQ